jgi:hypothetical protein
MMREPEDAELVCNAVTHWWNAEHRWEWGVRQCWAGGEPEVVWLGDRLRAGEWLTMYDPDNPPSEARLVRRLIVTGLVEEVPGDG